MQGRGEGTEFPPAGCWAKAARGRVGPPCVAWRPSGGRLARGSAEAGLERAGCTPPGEQGSARRWEGRMGMLAGERTQAWARTEHGDGHQACTG